MPCPRMRIWTAFFCSISVLSKLAVAQTFFIETTQEVSTSLFPSRSTTFGDYDNDGWPDMFSAESAENTDGQRYRLSLLHNEGNGRLTDQTSLIQAGAAGKDKGGGTIFGDYDNDGDLDLFVPIGAYKSAQRDLNLLLRNDRGTFIDATQEAGLTDSLPTDNAIWLDYDRDGYLDLYTGNLGCDPPDPEVRNKLYRNKGNATFTDMTGPAGLDVQLGNCGGSNGGMAAADFNNDGWPDLYVGVFNAPNRLFLSNGQGSFKEETSEIIANPGGAWGIAVGDIDNDGDLDIFQASRRTVAAGHPSLLSNQGEGGFSDITEEAGLSVLRDQKDLLAAGLADIDNDGDVDLLTGNPFLFLNDGKGSFTDHTDQSGIADVYLGMSFGDYDLDGFPDAWFGYSQKTSSGRVFRNKGNDNHWLEVELVGIQSNRSAIGARVVALSGDLRQTQELLGGMGYNQHESVAHFGLGKRTQVDLLEVHWPSGQLNVLRDIPSDQKVRIFEGRQEYHVVRPTVWESLPSLANPLTPGTKVELRATLQPALFEAEAQIVSVKADLSSFGGPAEVSLIDVGDGRYRLETAFTVKEKGVPKEIVILIEQATTLGGLYWTRVVKRLAEVPDEITVPDDFSILDDRYRTGMGISTSYGQPLLSADGPVFRGKVSVALQSKPQGGMDWQARIQMGKAISARGYKVLRFAFHPGDTIGSRFSVTIWGNSRKLVVKELRGGDINLETDAWQVVEIPLETTAEIGQDIQVSSVVFEGDLIGTFYIDDLRLSATPLLQSTTAVLEEQDSLLPHAFSLTQNYPNPFNGETAIRFTLPATDKVSLTIYDFLGQRVATLIEGRREAGMHTAYWNGKDDEGRESASGVYFYRLQTGIQLETRKLLLLR